METLATIMAAVLTVVSPLGIAWAKSESWSKVIKVAVPILVSLVIATAYLWASGQLYSPAGWAQTILAVYGAQQLAYTTILRWWASILEQAGQKTGDGPAHRADHKETP